MIAFDFDRTIVEILTWIFVPENSEGANKQVSKEIWKKAKGVYQSMFVCFFV